MTNINNKLEKKYNFTSKFYDILDAPFEAFRYKNIRKTIWKLGKGRILDAGIGTGRNIPFYPKNSEVFGIDLSNGMLKKAKKRAEKLNRKVKIHKMDIIKTTFPDNYFDTIVSTFLFCVLTDELQPKALKEMKRICKSTGRLILLEYEYSKNPLRKFFMRLMAPYVELIYGARFDRNTLANIKKEKFHILKNSYAHSDIIKIIVLKPDKKNEKKAEN